MSKESPFTYVKSINQKTYMYDLSGYNPYLTNRAFAMHIDTIMLAEYMNQSSELGPQLQYDFYFYSVRKGKRFGFPSKQDEDDNISVISEYFGYSKQKAIEAMQILTEKDITEIIQSMDKGGNT